MLDLCSPCSYIYSVAHRFVCFSALTHRGMSVCICTHMRTHSKTQAASKSESVINPPQGKHSSR